jgi:hypothetical protein
VNPQLLHTEPVSVITVAAFAQQLMASTITASSILLLLSHIFEELFHANHPLAGEMQQVALACTRFEHKQ